jgi:hypothetical protein
LVKKKRSLDKAIKPLSKNPKHPSLNVHKAKNVKAKYPSESGDSVFIACASKDLRFTFEFGPEPGMIALRNSGYPDKVE